MNLKILKIIFYLSVTGVIFAAIVTIRQIIAPATEPGIFSCVGLSILGLTPCPYGLTLFILLAILSGLMLKKQTKLLIWLKLTAVIGVIFSGWVSWRELCLPAIQKGPVFWETFALTRVSSCVWGFLIFLVIMLLAMYLKPMVHVNK